MEEEYDAGGFYFCSSCSPEEENISFPSAKTAKSGVFSQKEKRSTQALD